MVKHIEFSGRPPECRLLAYKAASLLAQRPTPSTLSEALDTVRQLIDACRLHSPTLHELAEAIAEALHDTDELEVEYTRLFVNAYPRLECPPYETVYAEHARRVMGRSGVEVAHIMDEAGLEVSEGFSEPPEHVAAETELMAYLIYLELTGDEKARGLAERLRRHLVRWIPEYARCLERAARHRLYRLYARFLQELAEAEAQG